MVTYLAQWIRVLPAMRSLVRWEVDGFITILDGAVRAWTRSASMAALVA
jgi:hypothetical protein